MAGFSFPDLAPAFPVQYPRGCGAGGWSVRCVREEDRHAGVGGPAAPPTPRRLRL